MSVTHSAALQDESIDAAAPIAILFNLPQELQIVPVLRALICAHEAGRVAALRDATTAALANIRLSSSRPS